MLHYFRFDLTNLNKTSKFRPYFATLSAHGPHFSYDSVYRFTFLPNSSVIFVDRSCCIVRVPNHFMDAYKHDDSFNKVARHTKQIYVLKRLYKYNQIIQWHLKSYQQEFLCRFHAHTLRGILCTHIDLMYVNYVFIQASLTFV
jgi:hypothetical protein